MKPTSRNNDHLRSDDGHNWDVDNILSKKFKPSSSHILEIYFEKSWFHKYLRAGLLSASLQVNTNRYWRIHTHTYIHSPIPLIDYSATVWPENYGWQLLKRYKMLAKPSQIHQCKICNDNFKPFKHFYSKCYIALNYNMGRPSEFSRRKWKSEDKSTNATYVTPWRLTWYKPTQVLDV